MPRSPRVAAVAPQLKARLLAGRGSSLSWRGESPGVCDTKPSHKGGRVADAAMERKSNSVHGPSKPCRLRLCRECRLLRTAGQSETSRTRTTGSAVRARRGSAGHTRPARRSRGGAGGGTAAPLPSPAAGPDAAAAGAESSLLPAGIATSAPPLREGAFRSGSGAQRAGRWSPAAAAAAAAAAPRDPRSARAAAATAGTERAAPSPSNAAAPAARPRREAARRPPRPLRPPGGGEARPPPPRPPRRRFPAPARPSAGLGSRAMAGR
ncbi:atherin-like [Pseudopipra pipra]|uniref:atherin-like n=1 Tax=Pseudopipra pipra TaxID=415032 RepID=UPI0031392EAD